MFNTAGYPLDMANLPLRHAQRGSDFGVIVVIRRQSLIVISWSGTTWITNSIT